jgi:hypothetical protein
VGKPRWRVGLVGKPPSLALSFYLAAAFEAFFHAIPKALAQEPVHIRPRIGIVCTARNPNAMDSLAEKTEFQTGLEPEIGARPGQAIVQGRCVATASQLPSAIGTLFPVAPGSVPVAQNRAALRTIPDFFHFIPQ